MLKLTLFAAAAAMLSALTLSMAQAAPLVGITATPAAGLAQPSPAVEKISYYRYGYGRRYYGRSYYGRSYSYGRSYARSYGYRYH